MQTLLYKLLGVPGDDIAKMADATLELRSGVSAGWVFLLLLAVIGLAAWSYHRWSEHLTTVRRWTLIGLRAAFLALLCLLLLRPVLHFTIEGSIRRAMLILFDGSASMQIRDDRSGDDLKRAAIAAGALDPARGLQQDLAAHQPNRVPRLQLAQSLLGSDRVRILSRLAEEYDLRPYRFGSSLEDLPAGEETRGRGAASPIWLQQITADDPATRLGDAVREAIGRSRGQPLAGIVLVTDGASNSGASPLAAADLARQQGVPLYIYGVGITAPRDVAITNLFAQPVAFFDDEVPVTVRVRARGMDGQRTRLRLQLVPRDPAGAPAEQTLEREIALEEGEQVVSLSITPRKKSETDKSREYNLIATLDPTGAEASRDALSKSQAIRVVDGQIKVLYIEQSPRWEYRYLQAMLARDRRVQLKIVLLDAGGDLSRDPNSPYLPAVPTDREQLFDNDLIIFGDVNPAVLTTTQLEMMREFVSKFGGGMLFLAGRGDGIDKLKGTPLEEMLPVELEAAPVGLRTGAGGSGDKPVNIELTPAGQRSTLMQLSDQPAENVRIWAELPSIYWAARVARAKPAAEVLLVDTDPARAWRNEKMPIFALHQFGSGQVFYAGTDNTWRWRRGRGEVHHTTLWSQIVQRLALPHLLGESNRTRLSSDRQEYATGDRITLFARLYNPDYSPLQQGQVEGTWRSAGGREGKVLLRQEQPGIYRGEMVAPQPGAYRFSVETDPATTLSFTVGEPKLELAEPAMNEDLLRQMATTTGGQFYREETLHELPDQVKRQTERVRSTLDIDIWSSPLFFLLLIGLVTAEWILRKMSQLK